MNHGHNQHVAQGLTLGGGLWLSIQEILSHGPGWASVPPLLLSIGALLASVSSFLKNRQELRHSEEKHAVELATMLKRSGWDVERLPSKN